MSKRIDIRLDRRGDLLKLGQMVNSKGEIENETLGLAESGIYCQKEDATGTEKPETDRETAFGKTIFTIRYRPDIDATMQWRCEGIYYEIENVREGPGRRQWTVLTCKTRN